VAGHVVTFGTRLGNELGLRCRKGCCSRCRCFLDGPAVVILVPRESGTAGKSLLAVGVGALVWSLARVCTPVASQGAAVAEGLGTGLAVVRLLAGVHALVDGQSGTLNELLATVRVVTDVRSVSCVNTFVTCQVTASREALSTSAARVCLYGLLGRLRLLRHVLHGHARHVGHAMHIREVGHLHGAGHGVWDV
jgi:hypothetical protein